MKSNRLVLTLLAIVALWWWFNSPPGSSPHSPTPASTRSEAPTLPPADRQEPRAEARRTSSRLPDFLPREAHDTLALIASGGPFAHRQDGSVFQNREQRLPRQPRGYYREYTVRTPGENDRGARRIVTGGDPPAEYWYTADHYRSFRRFEVPQ